MQHDTIIDCPKSGGDLCYKIEINKDITNFHSLSCGFWTNSLMTEGSKFYNEQIETLPELYKALAWTDPKTDFIWLPNMVNVEEKGIVFADGTGANNWSWGAAKAVKIPEEEKEKFKGKEYRADMTTLKHFVERDYIEALSYIGVLPE
jgi:hypothetical protein